MSSKTIEEMLDAGMSISDIMRKATEIKKKKDAEIDRFKTERDNLINSIVAYFDAVTGKKDMISSADIVELRNALIEGEKLLASLDSVKAVKKSSDLDDDAIRNFLRGVM